MSRRLTKEGAGLLTRNLVRLVAMVLAERQLVILIQEHGPQSGRELSAQSHLPRAAITRYLGYLKRRGVVRCHPSPRSPVAVWMLPGQVLPERRRTLRPQACAPARRLTDRPAATSWWITDSRPTFLDAARRRALEAGWDG